jgi:hypothetical protein
MTLFYLLLIYIYDASLPHLHLGAERKEGIMFNNQITMTCNNEQMSSSISNENLKSSLYTWNGIG